MPGSLGLQPQCWQVSAHKSASTYNHFFVLYAETDNEELEAVGETGSPPQLNPFSSCYQVSFQSPRLLPAGQDVSIWPFSSQTHRESSLARGKKCNPHRRAVLKRTPLGCKALCNNSKDWFLSEDVLLSGLADDMFFLPNQTKDAEMHLGRSVPQTAWLPLRLSPASLLLSAPKSQEAHNQDSGICGLNFKPLLQTAGL